LSVAARLRSTPTAVLAVAAVLAWVASGAVMFHFGASWHLDLRVYRAAGQSLLHGGAPFSEDFTSNHLPFTYPPFALLAVSALSFGRLGLVETLWWFLTAGAFVVAIFLMLRTGSTLASGRAWALAALLGGVASLALEPARSNFDYGQINTILMLLVVVDLTRAEAPWRGLLVGVAGAIKLTPLVFLVTFLVVRDWRSLARGAGAFVAATAVGWAVLPSGSDRYWFHEAFDAGRTGALGVVSNQSWNGMVHRPPFGAGTTGTAVWLLCSMVTLAGGALLTRWLLDRRATVEAVLALALTGLLISPVSWTHHWSWLVMVPVVAVRLWPTQRGPAVALLVLLAAAVAAPYLWVHLSPLTDLTSNSLVLAGAAALGIWVAAERRRRPSGADAVASAGTHTRDTQTAAL